MVGDIDIAGRIDGDAKREAELTVARSAAAELEGEDTGRAELLDVAVVYVGDKDVAFGVGGDAPRVVEVGVARAQAAPLGEEGAIGVELLDPVVIPHAVAVVGDVDVAGGVGGDAIGGVKLAVARAAAAPFGDKGVLRRCRRRGDQRQPAGNHERDRKRAPHESREEGHRRRRDINA